MNNLDNDYLNIENLNSGGVTLLGEKKNDDVIINNIIKEMMGGLERMEKLMNKDHPHWENATKGGESMSQTNWGNANRGGESMLRTPSEEGRKKIG